MAHQLPIRRNQFKVAEFLSYLAENGCEIGKPSNPYEVVRYRAYHGWSTRPVTHIVYAKQTGLLNWMPGTQGHYHSFLAGTPLTGNAPRFVSQFDGHFVKPGTGEPFGKTGRKSLFDKPSKAVTRRAKLLERDGPDCWFCGIVMGDDCTIEHLVPKSKDGPNSLANFALAHAKCNHDAADLPLVAKIAMRERLRSERVS